MVGIKASPMADDVVNVAATFALGSGWGPQCSERSTQMGPRLQDPRMQRMKDLFSDFDVDGTGTITRAELEVALTRVVKMSQQDIDALMEEADKNKDGVLDIDEFLSWLCPPVASDTPNIFDYGPALRPLFNVYDRNKNGVISYKEFEECHCILQGALKLNPTDGCDDWPLDVMNLQQEAKQAFDELDTDRNRNLGFVEFSKYMSGIIAKAGVSEDDLTEITTKLSLAFRDVLSGIQAAEEGLIPEDEPIRLARLVESLAEAARDLQDVLQPSGNAEKLNPDTVGEKLKWISPPRGMSVSSLKLLHMSRMPLNVRLVEFAEFELLCVPAPGSSSPEERTWYAEVARTITIKSGQTRKESWQYYEFIPSIGHWRQCEKAMDTDKFTFLLRPMTKGLGMYHIFTTLSDYGDELGWKEIKKGLMKGVDIGWLTVEDRMKFQKYIEDKALDEVKVVTTGPEEKNQVVHKFLHTSFKMRPRLIMANLVKLKMVETNHAWGGYAAM